MKPLLSIIVPTKDRYKYLKHLIALIDSFYSNEIELILQDNTADNREIIEFIKQKEHPYLKYYHNPKQIPVSYNSDLAVLNSNGEYVCYIGDDDGVTSHIIECVKWMKTNNIDVAVPASVVYLWPDYHHNGSVLKYKRFSNKIELVDLNEALNRSLKNGFINRGILPLLYHGIVKRSVLDKIYEIGGTFFPGPSPDIANGVALCFTAKVYARVDFPIVISGASARHAGGIHKLKNRLAKIEDCPFLPKNAKENWEKNLPKIWAGETVWPESAIKALRYMGYADIIEKVNFEYAQAMFITGHLAYWKETFKSADNYLKLIYTFMKFNLLRIPKGILRRLKNHIAGNNHTIIIYEIKDIQEAQKHLLQKYPCFLASSQ